MQSMIEIAEAIRNKEKSASEVMDECLKTITVLNPEINAFTFVDEEGARAQAQIIDQRIAKGEDVGPLAGVPIGIKDLFEDVSGMPTSQGSMFFKGGPLSDRDSVMVSRLKAAGAIPVGKVASAEFGTDGTGSTQAWGDVHNAWGLGLSAGGSSGGSSAAVTSGMIAVCSGGDGGGSIRCPASFAGLVGFKPSLGMIPRYNGFSDTTSLGSLTMTVGDTARYLDVTAGPHDSDRMTLPKVAKIYEDEIESCEVAGLRVIWSDDFGYGAADPEVSAIARAAADKLIAAAKLQLLDENFTCINSVEAWTGGAANSMRCWFEAEGLIPDRIDELSRMPRWLIEAYRNQTSTDLHRYKIVLKTLEEETAALFERADLLITPTVGTTAFPTEGPLPDVRGLLDSDLDLRKMLIDAWTKHSPFCMLANFCWNPSISVPAGVAANGMPVGLMITARRHSDEIPLRLARILEQVNPWPRNAPGYE